MWRSIFGSFGVRVLSALLNLALVILFSQLTGAAGKGEQSLLLTSVAIITIFDSFIGGAALVYLSSRYAWVQLLKAAYVWILLVSFSAYILLFYLKILSAAYLLDVIVLSAISALSSVHTALILGQQRIKAYNAVQIAVPLLTLLTCLLQWYVGASLNYALALYIAYTVALLLSCIFVAIYYPKSTPNHTQTGVQVFKQMAKFGFFNQLAHVLQLLSFRASYYLLEEYNGNAAVGIFSNASSITESIWLIATSISLWQYAAISNSDNHTYTLQITEKLTRFGLIAALFGVVFFLVLPADFYAFVFGKEFSALQFLMLLLAPGVWAFTYALVVGHYFSGHGKYWVNALASGIGLLFSLAFSFLLIPNFSTAGAAIAASLSYIATSAVVLFFFRKEGGAFTLFPYKAEWQQFFTQIRVLWRRSSL
ncbi:MAG: polysaccharide biosynthesis C-terminal domain-containing protein [Flavobacteriales bacterium]